MTRITIPDELLELAREKSEKQSDREVVREALVLYVGLGGVDEVMADCERVCEEVLVRA